MYRDPIYPVTFFTIEEDGSLTTQDRLMVKLHTAEDSFADLRAYDTWSGETNVPLRNCHATADYNLKCEAHGSSFSWTTFSSFGVDRVGGDGFCVSTDPPQNQYSHPLEVAIWYELDCEPVSQEGGEPL